MAEQMAEVSRNRNRVQSLAHEVERKDELIAHKDREVAALSTQLDVARAQLAAAHQTIGNLSDETKRQDEDLLRLQDSFRKLGETLREKNALVGNLNDELRASLTGDWRPVPHVPALPEEQPPMDIDARLRQRVAQLTSISQDITREHEVDQLQPPEFAAGSTAVPTPFNAETLNRKVAETERLSSEMEQELKNLDQLLASSINENAAEPATPKKQGAMANVITLAQRIRALQHGMDN